MPLVSRQRRRIKLISPKCPAGVDVVPQRACLGKVAVVLGADQPVGGLTEFICAGHQRRDVAFPIRHIDQACLR